MVDKGFLIEKEVEEIGLLLNIPPFARADRQMPHADVEMTKRIAKHRVHVERAIAKIKKFKNCVRPNPDFPACEHKSNMVCSQHAV